MGSIRQQRVEKVIQEEISKLFQKNMRELCKGAMVSVTVVRITPDLSFARVYVSIFGGTASKEEVLENIQNKKGFIRGVVGKSLKNMHHIPDFTFAIDDSLDYAEKIDDLLKK